MALTKIPANLLDKSAHVDFADSERLRFGNNQDLQIYHDGTNSLIDNSTGNLTIDAGVHLFLKAASGESLATFLANGASQLYYDNALKLATTSTGIAVTGTATGAFSGTISGTTATASGGTNTTALASTAFVQQELTTLIGGAPSTLNDLNELAAAINDDANYNTTLTTALATKAPLASPTFTSNINVTGSSTLGSTAAPLRTLDSRGSGMAIFGTGGYTEIMLRERSGTLRNTGAWHWSVRGDVGGANDDLKLLRFTGGSYQGIAMQLASSSGAASFTSDILISGTSIIGKSDDTDTYLQFNSANQLRVVTNGAQRLAINDSGISVTGTVSSSSQIKVAGSNASTVALSVGDTGTGWYNTGSNSMGYSTNGANKLTINNSGGFNFVSPATFGTATLSSATNMLLTLNPTAGNYGGILFQYGGATKGSSIYNSGMMVYGGESSTSLALQSGGQYGLFIHHATRNVGIGTGTSAPSYKLQVTGTLGVSGAATFSSTVTSTSFATAAGGTFTTAAGNDLNIVYPASRSLFIKEGSETHLSINNSGNVGIGIASAYGKLQIEGASQSWATAPVLVFSSSTTGDARVRDWAIGPADSSYGDFHILQGASTGSSPLATANSKMHINSVGNVAIGNAGGAIPAAANLYIKDTNDARVIIYESGGSPYTSTLELASQAIGTYGALVQYTSGAERLTISNYGRTLNANSPAGSIAFKTKLNNSNHAEVMFIHGFTGNVGIGTTTPVSRLEVLEADTSGNFQGITTTNTGINNAKSGIAFKAYDWVQSAIYHHRGTGALILATNPNTNDLTVGGVVPRIMIENDGTVIQFPVTGAGRSETRILARVTPNYPSAGQSGTAQNWYSPAIGESGIIHFGNTNNSGGEYRCTGYIVFSRAQSGGAMTIAVTESIGAHMVAFAVSGAYITVQNTYGYTIELMGRVESFRRE